ncbi:MAG: prolyl oligopeptidase family serine peptidase [bacterium]|nr:prolyl oligopeptidase family serine peptidase [bacterium]
MKILLTILIFVLAFYFLTDTIHSQNITGKNVPQQFHKEVLETHEVNYLLYLPDGYDDASKPWPLVLFLHGAGERGSDLEIIKRNGPPKLVDDGREFPFVLVSPQCPERTTWDNKLLIHFLDEIEAKYNIDKNREYLTGLSMGGHATWSLAIQNPGRFAAIIPVCARGYSQDVYVLKDLPVWAFHGERDDIVPITDGQKMVDALKNAGGRVKFTIYPEANHDAWTETYNNPEIYDWLLNHSLEKRKKD